MTKKALVTGASGFIGRHVARTLADAGYRVLGIGRGFWDREEQAAFGISEWYSTGVTREALTDHAGGVDVIHHCAGSGSVALSLKDPRADFECNVTTTFEVLEFARQRAGVKVVIPSSAGVYGCASEMPIGVTAAHRPVSPYGINKAIGETLTRQYAAHFDVPAVVVRLFSVYGEGLHKQLLWDACNKLMRGEREFFGTGEETRDWIHVEDAARLLVAAAATATTQVPTMNGATGTAVRIRDVVEGLATQLGVEEPICFSGRVRPGDPQHYEADITEALATGWRPRVPFSEGLARYVRWFEDVNRES